MRFELEEISMDIKSRNDIADDIGKRSTNYARYAMADVEFALAQIGERLSMEQYEKIFKAMMIRKAKNEMRKYNAE